ncbi:amidohydrolase family protein [Amycolatopsis sp. NPDC004368]
MSRIDVHAHFVPGFYRDALQAAGQHRPDGIKGIPEWSESAALHLMDGLDIERAVLSISSPGVHFGDAGAAVELAARCNDESARLKRDHAGRFGFFACLPVPEVDAAVAETRRAFDELDADGIVLQTNTRGVYPADPSLAPLWAELDRRCAVVFLHPTSPHCSAEELSLGYPRPMLEFLFDTTRAVTDLALSGVLQRHPNVDVIVPHAGATLPVLASRIELLLPLLTPPGGEEPPSVHETLSRLHFDLAGAPVPQLLTALLDVADPAHLHYGSDFPFTPDPAARKLAGILDTTDLLDARLRAEVMCGNARKLFDR